MGKLRANPRRTMTKASPSIEELARQQGVAPATDLAEIASLWPDDDADALLDFIIKERRERRQINSPNGKKK
jgi:hypothetical protein